MGASPAPVCKFPSSRPGLHTFPRAIIETPIGALGLASLRLAMSKNVPSGHVGKSKALSLDNPADRLAVRLHDTPRREYLITKCYNIHCNV